MTQLGLFVDNGFVGHVDQLFKLRLEYGPTVRWLKRQRLRRVLDC